MFSAAVQRKEETREEYKMINSLAMENFRCFKKVSLADLKTVNVIVGRNASGKTALLEALYLTLGSPALAFKLKGLRGIGGQVQYTDSPESRAGVWRDLFYKFDQNLVVRIDTQGSHDISRSVKITCPKKESLFIPKKGKLDIQRISPIIFRYYRGIAEIAVVKPIFTGDGVQLHGSPDPLLGSFYSSALPIDPQETANHYSVLSKKKEEASILVAMQELFPEIEGLSIEINSGLPMVYAALKGVSEKLPLGLVSTGINKALAYLTAIAHNHGGIVIVDEIENGFYYTTMGDVWKTLHKFCLKHETQLFASTHSKECLQALADYAQETNPNDFGLIRAVRDGEHCIVRQFSGEQFTGAVEDNIEIR